MKLAKILMILFALAALIGGLWAGYFYTQKNTLAGAKASTIFSPPQEVAQFSLIDTKGRAFNNNSLWGQWTFMFFGFTNCGQICPTTMSHLNQMYQFLLKEKQNPMPQIMLISVDPERDTLKKLGDYVQSFNPHFQGATGDKAEIDKLASSVSVLYVKSKDKKTGETTIDHSGTILLLDPNGKLIAIFSPPHDPAQMVKDFQLIVANSG